MVVVVKSSGDKPWFSRTATLTTWRGPPGDDPARTAVRASTVAVLGWHHEESDR